MRSVRFGLSLALWIAILLPATVLASGPTLTFGVLTSRPEAVLQEKYEPLIGYLSEAIGQPMELRLLDQREMDRALAANRLDFILTNPSHFLMIRSERSLSGVLATVVRSWEGTATTSLGGVIIRSAGRPGISRLADIRGKSIAAPGEQFLGGYQAQVLELLEAGLDVRRRNRFKMVGSHDRVVRAVLTGEVEVGFVRSSILEQLARKQPGLLEQLQVVNEQQLTGFPFRVSTRLYPEWPLVALPHVDSRVVRRTASALFALEADSPVARTAGIAGFSPPADYQSVEYLARKLRIAPFDKVPELTWVDALHQYRLWVFTVLVLMTLLTASALWLGKRTRQLAAEQGRLRRLILSWPQPMLVIQRGVFVGANRSALELFGFASRSSLMGKSIDSFSPEFQPDGQISRQKMATLLARVKHGEVDHGEWVIVRADGARLWVDMTVAPTYEARESEPFLLCALYDITRRKQAEHTLHTLAHYDALTGLPNRVLFADRLQQAMAQARRQEYQIAVVYIDLDEFKPVNDAFGHEAGDKLLVEIAERMRLALREEDTLARLGGDEFSALVVNVGDEDDLEGLLSRVLRAVSTPVVVADHSVTVSASIGFTLFPQLPDLDGDQLLRQADQAMYRAKQQGKNRYCRFGSDTA